MTLPTRFAPGVTDPALEAASKSNVKWDLAGTTATASAFGSYSESAKLLMSRMVAR